MSQGEARKTVCIRLNSRERFAWEILGPDIIREMIAPQGVCVNCLERRVDIRTRNGWFCSQCGSIDVQERDDAALLINQCRVLRQENTRLKAELKKQKICVS